MAELVDALDSKSCFGNGVQVRFLFWAPSLEKAALVAAFLILGHESFPMKKISGFRLFTGSILSEKPQVFRK